MLTHKLPVGRSLGARISFPARQGGVVLLISLIILVAMTLGGIALVRSIDTTNIIAGNLAFQQAATHSSEAGTEDAINAFLETSIPTSLRNDDFTKGYAASTPAAGNPANWDTYWSTVIDPVPKSLPVAAKSCGHGAGRVCTLPTNAAGNTGNTVSYTIQRLCAATGDPLLAATGCASASQKTALSGGGSLASGSVALPMVSQYYYRITTRTVGPRNTVSYIQTIVAR